MQIGKKVDFLDAFFRFCYVFCCTISKKGEANMLIISARGLLKDVVSTLKKSLEKRKRREPEAHRHNIDTVIFSHRPASFLRKNSNVRRHTRKRYPYTPRKKQKKRPQNVFGHTNKADTNRLKKKQESFDLEKK